MATECAVRSVPGTEPAKCFSVTGPPPPKDSSVTFIASVFQMS